MNSLVLFLPFLLIMGGFIWFSSRQRRRVMQATIDLHESLQPGDRVHTTSGLEATVTAVGDDSVDLEIAPGVVTTWMKLAIRDRILPDEPDLDGAEVADDLEELGDAGEAEDAAEEPAETATEIRVSKDA